MARDLRSGWEEGRGGGLCGSERRRRSKRKSGGGRGGIGIQITAEKG